MRSGSQRRTSRPLTTNNPGISHLALAVSNCAFIEYLASTTILIQFLKLFSAEKGRFLVGELPWYSFYNGYNDLRPSKGTPRRSCVMCRVYIRRGKFLSTADCGTWELPSIS